MQGWPAVRSVDFAWMYAVPVSMPQPFVCVCVYVCSCVCACMCVCMNACMCVCVYVRVWKGEGALGVFVCDSMYVRVH